MPRIGDHHGTGLGQIDRLIHKSDVFSDPLNILGVYRPSGRNSFADQAKFLDLGLTTVPDVE